MAPRSFPPETRALAQSLLGRGYTRARAVAEFVIDEVVIDRLKEAGALGLHEAGDARAWVEAELTHAAQFGRRRGGLGRAELRAMLEAAMDAAEVPLEG